MRKVMVVFLMVLMMCSCVSLRRSDKSILRELKSYGISPTEQKVKHPGVAGALNILPGFGNFYLAVGTEESDQWLYGFLNLLLWPLSVVWGVPEAAIDANNINKLETIYYYKFDREGKREFEKIKYNL